MNRNFSDLGTEEPGTTEPEPASWTRAALQAALPEFIERHYGSSPTPADRSAIAAIATFIGARGGKPTATRGEAISAIAIFIAELPESEPSPAHKVTPAT
jgi:hypothetical protein